VQEVKFYETYYFCNIIRNILHDQFSYIRHLNEFYGDDLHYNLVRPFEKISVFHYFIEFIVEDVYYDETSSIDLEERKKTYKKYKGIPGALEDFRPTELPIELALNFHKIDHIKFSEFILDSGKTFLTCDVNDVHDYIEEMKLSVAYATLVEQTVKEVFYVLFQNRQLMLLFNQMISSVIESSSNDVIPEDVKHLFKSKGTLNRRYIPKWVQRSVYFRDRGRCVLCDMDLSGTINIENIENYDHMVPLARHGLNDISNIQLLCGKCNSNKLDGEGVTSSIYQSWYPYDET
jgi:hypothetical protein